MFLLLFIKISTFTDMHYNLLKKYKLRKNNNANNII